MRIVSTSRMNSLLHPSVDYRKLKVVKMRIDLEILHGWFYFRFETDSISCRITLFSIVKTNSR